MTLLMRDQENQEIGEERGIIKGERQGILKGEERMLMLIEKLIEEKRFDDIPKIRADKTYLQNLYLEYNIPF